MNDKSILTKISHLGHTIVCTLRADHSGYVIDATVDGTLTASGKPLQVVHGPMKHMYCIRTVVGSEAGPPVYFTPDEFLTLAAALIEAPELNVGDQ
jgi:hypothetical protein